MKRLFALLLIATMLLLPVACTGTPENTNTETTETQTKAPDPAIRLMAMTGPTGMGLANLIHNDTVGSGNRCDYTATLVSSPDQVVAPIAKGECDIAAVPINLAATLYQKTNGQIQILCANTLGVLYMVENGNEIQSVDDLKGKTIYAPNPGSTPEYVLRYVLRQNGIDPEMDIVLEFLTGGDEVAAKLASTPNAIGMLPEPKLSAFLSANSNFRVCLDMTEEWDAVAGEGNTLVQGVFVARKAFVDEHPELVAKFLDDYNDSQAFVKQNPDLGAQYIVDAKIIPQVGLAKKALPGANITFLEGEEMKSAVKKCLAVLHEANSASVGGKLPADDIYFAR